MIEITRSMEVANNPFSEVTPPWETWRHFILTLESDGATMVFHFSVSWGEIPTIEDVIEHLEELAQAYEKTDSLEEWAEAYDLNPDHPLTKRQYSEGRSIVSDFRHLQKWEKWEETPS